MATVTTPTRSRSLPRVLRRLTVLVILLVVAAVAAGALAAPRPERSTPDRYLRNAVTVTAALAHVAAGTEYAEAEARRLVDLDPELTSFAGRVGARTLVEGRDVPLRDRLRWAAALLVRSPSELPAIVAAIGEVPVEGLSQPEREQAERFAAAALDASAVAAGLEPDVLRGLARLEAALTEPEPSPAPSPAAPPSPPPAAPPSPPPAAPAPSLSTLPVLEPTPRPALPVAPAPTPSPTWTPCDA